MAQAETNKWNLPGWKIENKYSPCVLFLKDDCVRATSSYRIDFRNPGQHQPDVTLRRNAALKTEGIGKHHLFNHHGGQYSHNLITLYDENYNRRALEESQLPTLRKWDQHSLSWQPEKSDYPLQGPSTKFSGMSRSVCDSSKNINASQCNDTGSGTERDFYTTYSSSYWPVPASARTQLRYATGRELSSHLHRQNNINKDLQLRGSSHFQAPEVLGPTVARPVHPDKCSSLA